MTNDPSAVSSGPNGEIPNDPDVDREMTNACPGVVPEGRRRDECLPGVLSGIASAKSEASPGATE